MMIDDGSYDSFIALFLCGSNDLNAFKSTIVVHIIINTHTYIIEMSKCVLSNIQIYYNALMNNVFVGSEWLHEYIYIHTYIYIYIYT